MHLLPRHGRVLRRASRRPQRGCDTARRRLRGMVSRSACHWPVSSVGYPSDAPCSRFAEDHPIGPFASDPRRGGWCGWCAGSMRWEPSRRASALSATVLACALAVAAIPSAVGTPAPSSRGQVASQRTPAETNPLANRTWGVYKGSGDQAWTPYQRARGHKKQLLAKIALAPKAKWYGQWIPKNQITAKVRDHITNAQAGDPEALVQMTVFRLKPWEEEACRRLPKRQGAAGLQEVDRQVRGRDRCRARGAGAAAGRAVRPVRAGWVAAAVPAGRATPRTSSAPCPTSASTSTPAPPTGCATTRRRR